MKWLVAVLLIVAVYAVAYYLLKPLSCAGEEVDVDKGTVFYMEGPFQGDDEQWYWKDYTGTKHGPYPSEVLAKKAHSDYLQMSDGDDNPYDFEGIEPPKSTKI